MIAPLRGLATPSFAVAQASEHSLQPVQRSGFAYICFTSLHFRMRQHLPLRVRTPAPSGAVPPKGANFTPRSSAACEGSARVYPFGLCPLGHSLIALGSVPRTLQSVHEKACLPHPSHATRRIRQAFARIGHDRSGAPPSCVHPSSRQNSARGACH